MRSLKTITKTTEIFVAGISRNNALFRDVNLKTLLSKSAILFLVLLIASLSTLVFSRTSFWTTNLVNLSLDSDFTLFVDVTNNRVGINTSDPTATLQVNGSVRVVPLASCNTIDTDANGLMSCGVDDAGGGASPWANSSSYIFTNATFPSNVNISNALFVNGTSRRVEVPQDLRVTYSIDGEFNHIQLQEGSYKIQLKVVQLEVGNEEKVVVGEKPNTYTLVLAESGYKLEMKILGAQTKVEEKDIDKKPEITKSKVETASLIVGQQGNTINGIIYGTVKIDPPALTILNSTTIDVTISNARVGDNLILIPPSTINASLFFQGATITTLDTVTIRLGTNNNTRTNSATVDDVERAWTYLLIKS